MQAATRAISRQLVSRQVTRRSYSSSGSSHDEIQSTSLSISLSLSARIAAPICTSRLALELLLLVFIVASTHKDLLAYSSSAAGGVVGAAGLNRWRNVSLLCFPVVGALFIYNIVAADEPGHRVEYPYMRNFRTREFTWGKKGLFEVYPLPEELEGGHH